MATGIYWVRIEAGSETATRKVVRMRVAARPRAASRSEWAARHFRLNVPRPAGR